MISSYEVVCLNTCFTYNTDDKNKRINLENVGVLNLSAAISSQKDNQTNCQAQLPRMKFLKIRVVI